MNLETLSIPVTLVIASLSSSTEKKLFSVLDPRELKQILFLNRGGAYCSEAMKL